VLLLVCFVAILNRSSIGHFIAGLPIISELLGHKTVEGQVAIYGANARTRLLPAFKEIHMSYPPDRVSFVAIKNTAQLQIYVASPGQPFTLLKTYPILGASGHLGPKLREGDRQVPEGIYKVTLEPNTLYHLALRLNYPNDYDLEHASQEKRNPGCDILIHGTTGSVGCLAMGDPASEDLFVLAADTSKRDFTLVICPVDFRIAAAPHKTPTDPTWLPDLYNKIATALHEFPSSATSVH
jgi:murein L,D-transpeptidase YafK